MRRAVPVLVACAGLLASCSVGTTTSSGDSVLESAALAPVAVPAPSAPAPPPPPPASFARTTYAAVTLRDADLMLDLCRGPVAIDLGEHRPVLLAEHDYCGGSAWIPQLDVRESVRLDGRGVTAGTYVVSAIVHRPRGDVRVRDLPPADVVLQTCVSPSELVLVGLTRHDAAA